MEILSALRQNPVLLAPMAGWTDVSYRTICKRMGAGLTYTEMVSAQGLEYGSSKTGEYLKVSDEEGQAVVQLFGSNPVVMAHQVQNLCETMGSQLAAIDINMGCPARKVVRKGEGSALMKTPKLAAQIVKQMVEVSSVPITVKFRRGFERGNDTAQEFAREMEAAGASAMCVHGRYAADLYHGKSDWNVVRLVREDVDVPVIASGDLMSARDVVECLYLTEADAAMIARGAQGNPWIFKQVDELMQICADRVSSDGVECDRASDCGYGVERSNLLSKLCNLSKNDLYNILENYNPAPIPLEERLRVARIHARMLNEQDPRTVVHMRNYFMTYFKGVPGASALRGQVVKCTTLEDFENFFDYIWHEALEHGYVASSSQGRTMGETDMGETTKDKPAVRAIAAYEETACKTPMHKTSVDETSTNETAIHETKCDSSHRILQ